MKKRAVKVKIFISILLTICVLTFSSVSFAYRLPKYSISDSDRSQRSEDVLKKYDAEMELVLADINPTRITEYGRNNKIRLTKKERNAYSKYDGLSVSCTFWNYVVDLKKDLVMQYGKNITPEIDEEADVVAKTVIETLYRLSQEYKVAMSALVNNLLIRVGAKEKGYCYHYVNDLMRALSKYEFKHFDILWGEAWPKTIRENNALVIKARGKNFNDGIAVDAWRTNGKPFWTKVRGDRFPWVELKNPNVED